MELETEVITNPSQLETESFISDLLDGGKPASLEVTADEANLETPTEGQPPVVKVEPKVEDGKPASAEVEKVVDPRVDVAVKTYEYNGRQYTVSQLIELGILDDVIQTARQFPTIQKKYQAILDKDRGVAEPGTPSAAGTQVVQAPPTGEQIHQSYLPEVQKMVQAGYIEPEAYEAFPLLVTGLMFHRDMIYDMRNAMQVLVNREVERGGADQRTGFMNYLNGLCGKVAGQGEHFKLLTDESVKNGFYEYLGTLRIPASEVDEGFIRRQWAAYNSEAMMEAASVAVKDGKSAAEDRKRMARGEGGAPRGPATPSKKGSDSELLDSLLEGSWPK